MSVHAGNGRAGGDVRQGRRSNQSVEDLAFDNHRLAREVVRLQALCEKHEANLLRLSQAMWQMRREAVQAESKIAALRREAQAVEELERSSKVIGLMAERHRLGIPDARGQLADSETAQDQSEGLKAN